jgi:hypothetical protein
MTHDLYDSNRRKAVAAAFRARETGDHREEAYLWGVAAVQERFGRRRPDFVASYRRRADEALTRALMLEAVS